MILLPLRNLIFVKAASKVAPLPSSPIKWNSSTTIRPSSCNLPASIRLLMSPKAFSIVATYIEFFLLRFLGGYTPLFEAYSSTRKSRATPNGDMAQTYKIMSCKKKIQLYFDYCYKIIIIKWSTSRKYFQICIKLIYSYFCIYR